VQFACLVFDGFYGRDSHLLEFIEQRGLTYCAEVPCNTNVFTQKPSGDSRPKKITRHTLSAGELARQIVADPARPATHVALREGENGLLMARVWAQRVWVWPAHQPSPRELWLLVRKMGDDSIKISLSNADAATPIHRLARWQGSRYHIERAFQNAKSHLGMGQYQSRGWLAWHHHMALVVMAHLFVMEERLLQADTDLALLSARDVVELLDYCLTKPRTADEVLARVMARHKQRRRNAASAQKRRREALGKQGEKEASFELPK